MLLGSLALVRWSPSFVRFCSLIKFKLVLLFEHTYETVQADLAIRTTQLELKQSLNKVFLRL